MKYTNCLDPITDYFDNWDYYDNVLYMPPTRKGWTVALPRDSLTLHKFKDPDYRLFILFQDFLNYDPVRPEDPLELTYINNWYKDKIDRRQVVIIVWNHGAAKPWNQKHPDGIRVLEFSPFIMDNLAEYKRRIKEIDERCSKHENPNYIAVCPNRLIKPHRKAVYDQVSQLPHINASMQQEGKELRHASPAFAKYDYNNVDNLINMSENFADAYLKINCETHYWEPTGLITEKTYHAVVTKTPFLMIGNAGLITEWEKQGFVPYEPLGGKVWDFQANKSRRLSALTYLPRSLKQAKTVYDECREVAEYNYNWMLNGWGDWLMNKLREDLKSLQ